MQHGADHIRLLREEVGLLRARESRRVFDVAITVGGLAAERDSFVLRAGEASTTDFGLRVDVLSALVGRSGPEVTRAWVTRPGAPHAHDVDLEWLAAANLAFAIHGRELAGFYAITRGGWLDVRTGEHRVWKRLRL